MRQNSIWLAAVLGGLLLLAPASIAGAAEAPEIGVVFEEHDEVKGVLTAADEALRDAGLVRTESSRAVVHLDNGQVLKLEPNSAARFDALPFDEVNVTVLSGCLSKRSATGKVLTAGSGSRFVLSPTAEDPMALEAALLADEGPIRRRDEPVPVRRLSRAE